MKTETLALFQDNYRDLSDTDPCILDQIYADDIVYRDPMQTIEGLHSLKQYLRSVNSKISHGGFRFTDISRFENENKFFLTWQLDMQLNLTFKRIKTEGITELWLLDDKIINHRDYLESVAEQV